MIHVELAPRPPGFDEEVRNPGLSAIAELVGEPPTIVRPGPRRKQAVVNGVPVTRREDLPSSAFPAYWQEGWLQALLAAYRRICAYVCVYIEPVTGAATVDHLIPKSVAWDRVYEWDNYRLACSVMNSRKHVAREVLDPFEIETGWFRLELVGFQVVPEPDLDAGLNQQVNDTIARLALNDEECRALRAQYAVDYWEGLIKLAYLERRAPFVALELRRQGRLRPGEG
jgi:hypothetical protein